MSEKIPSEEGIARAPRIYIVVGMALVEQLENR